MTLYFFVNIHVPLFQNVFYLCIVCFYLFITDFENHFIYLRWVSVVEVGVGREGTDSAAIAANDLWKRVGRGRT
jgi:hypothetical protein